MEESTEKLSDSDVIPDTVTQQKLSIIVTGVTGLPAIAECVASLVRQTASTNHEIIVVESLGGGAADSLRALFPQITVVEVEGRPGIPFLRAIGCEHADGGRVAFVGEHYLPDDRWVERTVDAFDRGLSGFGGPIEMLCPPTLTNWAVYLTEYSSLMLPIAAGETGGVPGNNCAYLRSVLVGPTLETLRTGWEFFLHQELHGKGIPLHFEPSMVVSLKRNFSIGRFLSIRFDFSRSFAGMRRERLGSKALIYALLAPALVPMMFWRVAEPVFRKRRYRLAFFRSSPLVVVFCVAAALGEAVGYLAGSGRSLGNVE
jgi:hypothetical protein